MNARERHIQEMQKVENQLNKIKDKKSARYKDLKKQYNGMRKELYTYDYYQSQARLKKEGM